MFVYVGCYTTPDRQGRGEGINVYRMNTDSGEWTHVQLLGDVPNPSFLASIPSSGVCIASTAAMPSVRSAPTPSTRTVGG